MRHPSSKARTRLCFKEPRCGFDYQDSGATSARASCRHPVIRPSDYGIQIARPPLDDALNLTRHPSAVKVARLGLHPLAVDEAVPRAGVEAQVPAQGLEPGRRAVVRPDAVGDGAVREADAVVGCSAFPLAPAGAGRGLEGGLDAGGREVVSWRVMRFQHPIRIMSVCNLDVLVGDAEMP